MPENFHVEETTLVPDLEDQEVLLRTLYLSVDPYMVLLDNVDYTRFHSLTTSCLYNFVIQVKSPIFQPPWVN